MTRLFEHEMRLNVVDQKAWNELQFGAHTVIHGFFPHGLDIKGILDPDHMPAITNFKSISWFPSHAGLRHQAPSEDHPARVVGAEERWIQEISTVALQKKGYQDTPEGKEERRRYTEAMKSSMRRLFEVYPVKKDEVVVGVRRCGSNILEGLGIPYLEINAKRLRVSDNPDLLGAGVNLPENGFREAIKGKHVRFVEGVVASGSTIAGLGQALEDEDIEVDGISTDAVIITPAGAQFLGEMRKAKGWKGEERCNLGVGTLNDQWYVEWHGKDPVEAIFGEKGAEFIGQQVLGDGGDLTSNII